VVLFEALYYLGSPERFFAECRRVLRPGGAVVISSVNREWADFNPSPYSTRYFSAEELREMLVRERFSPEIYGAFGVASGGARDRVVSALKRTAVSLHLIPRTMKGKEWLKRVFLGKLSPLPAEVTGDMCTLEPLTPLPEHAVVTDFKMLYAVGKRR
jgi:SAM-dependent methyltransferase